MASHYTIDQAYTFQEQAFIGILSVPELTTVSKNFTMQKARDLNVIHPYRPDDDEQDGNCDSCWKRGTHGQACKNCKHWVRAVDAGLYDGQQYVFDPRIVARVMGHWDGYDRIQTVKAKKPPKKTLTEWNTSTRSPLPHAESARLKMVAQQWDQMNLAESSFLGICSEKMERIQHIR